ncbi:uncharacterized protein LOC110233779 [Rhizophagus irregularis DAOM 181602=DAOM 197198]|nr:uncharacterized protein LOC110233779 [Rhizophagus irregularis DAOM 181602=DAOM 197198]
MSTKLRYKVSCDCKECNGKYVDERTRKRHLDLERHLASSVSGFVPFLPGNNRIKPAHTVYHSPIVEGSSRSKEMTGQEESTSFNNNYESDFAGFVPQKRRRQDQFREPETNKESNEPINEYEYEGDISPEDNMDLDDDPVEQFAAPENDSEFAYPDTNVNIADSWILTWIFKYQARFCLPDVALDSLIKFFHQVLMDANQTRFKDFPSSLYTATKLLRIDNQSMTYAVCPSCNTLYNIADVVADEGFKCTHIEFPMKPKEKFCGMELTVQVPHDTSDVPFFTPETADSHLGIMINLDWFQPFESSVYSCRAIYGVICNLPREIRFKKENMLTLGLLPGPSEVKLHKINHYLTPIVDELLEFWDGIEIPAAEKNIRLALICCSNDIPAARKLCGHISASVSCHRCYKTANSNGNGNKSNFGGFDDMVDWFVERDLDEHRRNAELWRLCKSEEERKRHVSSTHVRWSELLRLPYFNPIRYLVVDPMHCLFLRIAHWIIKKLWIDGNKITKQDLEKMEKRAKYIQIPADLGRIPNKIATGEGFSRFTADQWKMFVLIYAIPLMWDLLAEPDRQILGNFVRACSLLVYRIIDCDILNEAHERLLKVATLIEENYGPERITPNLHLCLHIADCCRDYGPLYSFWCFSFERMNGILGSFPNSNRQIEPELLRIIMRNWRLDNLVSVQSNNVKLVEALKLIQPRSTSGSLAAYDNFNYTELYQFRKVFFQEVDETIVGSEPFPEEMLTPCKNRVALPDDIYQILTEYYNIAYDLQFVTIAESTSTSSRDAIVVPNMVDQFGRVRISAEVFGSAMAPRYLKNANVLAKFIQNNETTDLFPGQVQYYFEHTVRISGELKTHRLVFVKWYKPAPNQKTRFYTSIDGDEKSSNIELWRNEFYEIERDCLIPIHYLYSRFVSGEFVIGKKNPITYNAVIPINRQFHL